MTIRKTLLASLIISLAACAPGADDGSDLPFDDDASGIGKADHLSVEFTPISANIDFKRREKGGKAIITSADSWVEYFGTDAPADVDFGKEWVAFFGSGLQNTGGYSAQITGISNLPSIGGIVLETLATSPGFDCIVTQALTTPHMIVKFTTPSPAPSWAVSDHSDEVNRCGPTNAERQAELADSLETWEAARDDAGNSYTYTRETHSFFANTSFKTTFVVEAGVVVERIATTTSGADIDKLLFHETGDEVGTNSSAHDVALIDDLYAECKSDVLTKDEDEHFINLSFDGGLLQSCTSFHRLCQDDCTRGPVITSIEF